MCESPLFCAFFNFKLPFTEKSVPQVVKSVVENMPFSGLFGLNCVVLDKISEVKCKIFVNLKF